MSRIHAMNGSNGIEPGQMADLFLDAIAEAIADRLEHRQDARRRLLNVEQTAEYLGMSESAIYNRTRWKQACEKAGVPEILFHDTRRAAIRLMEQAGIPRAEAMQITGHKTEAVYKR